MRQRDIDIDGHTEKLNHPEGKYHRRSYASREAAQLRRGEIERERRMALEADADDSMDS